MTYQISVGKLCVFIGIRGPIGALFTLRQEILNQNFPAGPVDRNLLAMDSIPGLGRSHMLWSN